MADERIALIRRFTDEACIGGKVATVDELVAADVIDHDPMPGQAPGRDGIRQTIELLAGGLSDRVMEQDDYLACGDIVVENFTMRGTHTGEFFGVPATGNDVHIRGIEIWRVAGGQLVEHWIVLDTAAVLAQLGTLDVAAAGSG